MENNVINLVISMHERRLILRLRLLLSKKLDHIIVMRDLAHGDLGVDIDRLSLSFGDRGKGLELAIVEIVRSTEVFESDGFGRYAVEFG